MMISDLIDQVDFIEGLNKAVAALNWQDQQDMNGALVQAAELASEEEWR